jgi:two-component system sensor histidine kinase/response regulator
MNDRKVNLTELRERAELAIADSKANLHDSLSGPTKTEIHRLVEELRIYQAELEIQNEELVQAQTAISQSLEKYRTLFNHLPLPGLVVDATGFIKEANSQACDFLNLSRNIILQHGSVFSFFDFESKTRLFAVLKDRHRQEAQTLEFLGLKLDSEPTIPCDVHVMHLSAESQHDGLTLMVLSDRTADLALRESEERFRTLFEDTTQPILLIEDGYFVAANQAALAQLRMKHPAQLIGRTPDSISPPLQPDGRPTAEFVSENIRIALAQGSYTFEHEHLRADGEPFLARVILTAIHKGDKSLLHVVWSDITAEKKAARELADYRQDLERRVTERTAELAATTASLRRASEEQRAFFDAATVGIVLIRDRRIIRCNRMMERLFGYGPGEMIGQTTRSWYPDETTFIDIGRTIAKAIEQQGRYGEDRELVRKDGSRFWGRMSAQSIDSQDLSKGLAGIIEDITEERAAMAEMARARALAEKATQSKADFLANMSHEIRTPMNAIIGLTHLIQKTALDSRQQDYLKKIQSSSQHLLGIINDILDVSKIESGKLIIEQVDFDLPGVLDSVVVLIAEKATEKGLELIIDVADAVPLHLIGDPLRLGQILINYANNAVKFTDQGEIAIRVRVVEANDHEVLLHFSVRDSGIGLSEEQCQSLFQSFQQADTSTTRQYGGTGLGLAISKRLAELMGGEVGVDSALGAGSTFWFTTRLGRGRTPVRRFVPPPALQGLRLLLVDDNDNTRKILGAMLRNMTFDVTAVTSGASAVEQVCQAAKMDEPYAVVCLDWKMPDMDGIATAHRIHRLALPKPPHLLMITADGRSELIRTAHQAGFEEVLLKPISTSCMFDTLMRLLGAGSPAQPVPLKPSVDSNPDLSALAGGRVLLVEDNDLNQEVAIEFLREAGLVVDVAANGAIAVEKVRHNTYDLVLMDLQMPVMDGLTATLEIRRLPDMQDLPIVAMTANAMAGDRDRCLEAGMNDHIAKPIDPHDLWKKLRRWMKPQAVPVPGAPRCPPTGQPAPAHHDAEIPGLDVALGLRQAMGREALYHNLLERFATSQVDAPTRIATALAAADWTGAERAAHTLKGVAAQIGAGALSALAAQLEHAIHDREHATQLSGLLAGLQADIASAVPNLIEAIIAHLPQPQTGGDQATAPTDDPEQRHRVVTRLALLLRNDDFSSEQVLNENEALLRIALGDRFPPAAAAIHNYDFASALDVLMENLASQGSETAERAGP